MSQVYKIIADNPESPYNVCIGAKQRFICTGCRSHGCAVAYTEKLLKESVKKWLDANFEDNYLLFESMYLGDVDATTYEAESMDEI